MGIYPSSLLKPEFILFYTGDKKLDHTITLETEPYFHLEAKVFPLKKS